MICPAHITVLFLCIYACACFCVGACVFAVSVSVCTVFLCISVHVYFPVYCVCLFVCTHVFLYVCECVLMGVHSSPPSAASLLCLIVLPGGLDAGGIFSPLILSSRLFETQSQTKDTRRMGHRQQTGALSFGSGWNTNSLPSK